VYVRGMFGSTEATTVSVSHLNTKEPQMILVTGAMGKNGTEILKRLSGRRERIRAMVHKQKDIVNATHNCALEFVEADFDDPASLRRALDGVQRAFLVTNSSERVEERQLRFVALARESGVKHIVYLSQLHASLDSPLRFLRYHAAVEKAPSRVWDELHQPASQLVHAGSTHDW
jgi:uncharacterized protein YbjT (DUF2867 family)